jgi:hypothetical protein
VVTAVFRHRINLCVRQSIQQPNSRILSRKPSSPTHCQPNAPRKRHRKRTTHSSHALELGPRSKPVSRLEISKHHRWRHQWYFTDKLQLDYLPLPHLLHRRHPQREHVSTAGLTTSLRSFWLDRLSFQPHKSGLIQHFCHIQGKFDGRRAAPGHAGRI